MDTTWRRGLSPKSAKVGLLFGTSSAPSPPAASFEVPFIGAILSPATFNGTPSLEVMTTPWPVGEDILFTDEDFTLAPKKDGIVSPAAVGIVVVLSCKQKEKQMERGGVSSFSHFSWGKAFLSRREESRTTVALLLREEWKTSFSSEFIDSVEIEFLSCLVLSEKGRECSIDNNLFIQ